MKWALHTSSIFENCHFLHLSAMTEIYVKLERWGDIWWFKLHSIWRKAVKILCSSSDVGRRMSALYHSTADTELCERSITRVNTRLKNNQTLRAVVKRSVNKQTCRTVCCTVVWSCVAVCGIDWSLNMSTDIVTRRRAGRLRIRGSIPARSKRIFFFSSEQNGLGIQPYFYSVGKRDNFFGGKAVG